MKVISVRVAIFPLFFFATTSAAWANEWRYETTPYLFATALDGTVGYRGVSADLHADFSDLLENIDSAFMLNFTASNGSWTLFADAIYADLEAGKSKSWSGPNGVGSLTGDLEASTKLQVYHAAAGYRLIDDGVWLDGLAGARHARLQNDLDLTVTTGGLLPGGTRSLGHTEDWWEPIVGLRLLAPISETFKFMGYVDYGFGNGDAEYSVQTMVGFDWQFAEKWSAKFGYRYLYWDYESDNGTVWDVSMEGVYFGAGLRF